MHMNRIPHLLILSTKSIFTKTISMKGSCTINNNNTIISSSSPASPIMESRQQPTKDGRRIVPCRRCDCIITAMNADTVTIQAVVHPKLINTLLNKQDSSSSSSSLMTHTQEVSSSASRGSFPHLKDLLSNPFQCRNSPIFSGHMIGSRMSLKYPLETAETSLKGTPFTSITPEVERLDSLRRKKKRPREMRGRIRKIVTPYLAFVESYELGQQALLFGGAMSCDNTTMHGRITPGDKPCELHSRTDDSFILSSPLTEKQPSYLIDFSLREETRLGNSFTQLAPRSSTSTNRCTTSNGSSTLNNSNHHLIEQCVSKEKNQEETIKNLQRISFTEAVKSISHKDELLGREIYFELFPGTVIIKSARQFDNFRSGVYKHVEVIMDHDSSLKIDKCNGATNDLSYQNGNMMLGSWEVVVGSSSSPGRSSRTQKYSALRKSNNKNYSEDFFCDHLFIHCSCDGVQYKNNTIPPFIIQETSVELQICCPNTCTCVCRTINWEVVDVEVIDEDGDNLTPYVCFMNLEIKSENRDPPINKQPSHQIPSDSTTCVTNSSRDNGLSCVDGVDNRDEKICEFSSRSFGATVDFVSFPMEGYYCELRFKITVKHDIRQGKKHRKNSEESRETIEFISKPFFVGVHPTNTSKSIIKPDGNLSVQGENHITVKNSELVESEYDQAKRLSDNERILSLFRTTASTSTSSFRYWSEDFLTPEDSLAECDFMDPGRSNPLLSCPDDYDRHITEIKESNKEGLMSQDRSIQVQGSNIIKNKCEIEGVRSFGVSHANTPHHLQLEREVIIVDHNDQQLANIIKRGVDVCNKILDTHAKALAVGWYVSSVFGGGYVDNLEFEKAMNSLRLSCGASNEGDGSPEYTLNPKKSTQMRNAISLGSIRIGICRHRSLLYKILCDTIKIQCFLVRGFFRNAPMTQVVSSDGINFPGQASAVENNAEISADLTEGNASNYIFRHSWNVISIDDTGQLYLVDCMHPVIELKKWPCPDYKCVALPPPNIYGKGTEKSFFCVATSDNAVKKEEVGKGASAVVCRITIGGMTCAMKIPKTDADIPVLQNEFRILSNFRSLDAACPTNIVQCIGWRGGLILEYIPMSLLAFMNTLLVREKRMSPYQILQVLEGLSSALVEVHDKGYVHRDVKAENILVAPKRCTSCIDLGSVVCEHCSLVVKLADFADCYLLERREVKHKPKGTKKVPNNTKTSKSIFDLPVSGSVNPIEDECTTETVLVPAPSGIPRVGTYPYTAPEIEAETSFTISSDLWSVGILSVEMANMRLPATDDSEACNRVVNPYASSVYSTLEYDHQYSSSKQGLNCSNIKRERDLGGSSSYSPGVTMTLVPFIGITRRRGGEVLWKCIKDITEGCLQIDWKKRITAVKLHDLICDGLSNFKNARKK